MKQSKVLNITAIILTIIIALITFTSLPSYIELGGEQKPSFFLILLSLLPIFSTMLCMEVKDYKALGYILFISIYFIILKIILNQFGIHIPMELLGGFSLSFLSLAVALYLSKIKSKCRFAINLAWIKTEDGFLKMQKKGAKVFFIYSALQAISLVLYMASIISINITFIVPMIIFALSIFIILKQAIHLD